jgi:hypothetical protein
MKTIIELDNMINNCNREINNYEDRINGYKQRLSNENLRNSTRDSITLLLKDCYSKLGDSLDELVSIAKQKASIEGKEISQYSQFN